MCYACSLTAQTSLPARPSAPSIAELHAAPSGAWAYQQSWSDAIESQHHKPPEQADASLAHHHKPPATSMPERAADMLGMPLGSAQLPWLQHAPPGGAFDEQASWHGSAQSVVARHPASYRADMSPPQQQRPQDAAGSWEPAAAQNRIEENLVAQVMLPIPEHGSWAAGSGSGSVHTPRQISRQGLERVSSWAASSLDQSHPATSLQHNLPPEHLQHGSHSGSHVSCLPAQQQDKWGHGGHLLDSLPGSGRIGVWATGQPAALEPCGEVQVQQESSGAQPLPTQHVPRHRGRRHKQVHCLCMTQCMTIQMGVICMLCAVRAPCWHSKL